MLQNSLVLWQKLQNNFLNLGLQNRDGYSWLFLNVTHAQPDCISFNPCNTEQSTDNETITALAALLMLKYIGRSSVRKQKGSTYQ